MYAGRRELRTMSVDDKARPSKLDRAPETAMSNDRTSRFAGVRHHSDGIGVRATNISPAERNAHSRDTRVKQRARAKNVSSNQHIYLRRLGKGGDVHI